MKDTYSASIDVIHETAIQWHVRIQNPNLSELEEQQFFKWLKGDPTHQAAFLNTENLWKKCSDIDQTRLKKSSPHKYRSNKQHAYYACAASLIFAVIGFFIFKPVDSITDAQMYSTGVGIQNTVQLSDGSSITLNTDTIIKTSFDQNSRRAYLEQGEIFLEVKPSNKPFEVITQRGVIRVLGTKFSVRKNDHSTEVKVLEGSVALKHGAEESENFSAHAILKANESLTLTQALNKVKPIKINANKAFAWKESQLVYDGQTLNEVITDLNRYHKTKLIIKDNSISNESVVAVLHIGRLESTIETLKQSLPIEIVRINHQEIWLKRKPK